MVGHPLQRIDPAPLDEGVQSHRQYLHCPHQVEPRWLRWLRRFGRFSQHALQLWPRFVAVGDIVRRAPRSLRWTPHNLVGVPVHHPLMLALVALRNNLVEEESRRKLAQHWVAHYPLVRRRIPPLQFFLFYFSLPGQGVLLPTNLPSLG
jgi:hypothetical protein